MRIGIDIRSLGERNQSGVAEYANNLLQNLFQIDQKNEYLLFVNSFRNDHQELKERFNYPNVRIKSFFIPNKVFNSSVVFLKYPKIDQLLKREGIDLFFAPNLQFLALTPGCKKIITVHDLSFILYPHFFSNKRRLWHQLVNPRRIYRDFDRIIAVSGNTKQDLVHEFGLPEHKIKVISSGINLQDFYQIDKLGLDRIKRKYQLPENFILTLSTLEPRKNISGLIRAFDKLLERHPQDLYLVIVGAKGWHYREIEKAWQNIKNVKRVKFIGYIDREEKPYLYQLAKLFVYPSFYEGFGFPPLESMASGTPVITSANSSLPEVVGEASFMVDPYDINELAQALYICLTDTELRNHLKQKGLSCVTRFSWEKTAWQTLELFQTFDH